MFAHSARLLGGVHFEILLGLYNALMSTSTQRVFYHVVGRPFLRGLVLPCFLALLLVAFSDATVLRQQIESLTPWAKTAVFGGLFLGWSLAAGHALRPIWGLPMIAFLVRQPLTRWQWVFGLLPSLGIAFVPVLAIWWLAPHYANPVIHYLGFVGLAWPIILGASYRAPSSIIVAGTGITSLMILVLAYFYFPFVAYVALLVTILQLPGSVALIRRQITQVNKQNSGHLSSAGVITALTRRDLRCLLRLEWKGLLKLALFSAIAPLMMLAFRVNGEMEGREAFLTACVLFSLAASTIYESLEKMKAHLGKEIMRHRWPVTYSQRGLALLKLIAVLVAPSAVLISLFGSTMGGYNLLLFFMFVTVTVTVCVALYSKLLGVRTTSIGLFWLLITFHGGMVFLLPAWAYAVVSIPAIFINFHLITSGLRKFSVNIERATLDQLA